jgi:hypothetical protein
MMNERIRELAEQAKNLMTDQVLYLSRVHNRTLSVDEGADIFEEKFAELIIKDIGQIVSGLIVPETFEQDIDQYEHWNRALATVALEIEQHFYGEAE